MEIFLFAVWLLLMTTLSIRVYFAHQSLRKFRKNMEAQV